MRVLTVSKGKSNLLSPFVKDQINSIREQGAQLEAFSIKGTGIVGYLKNLPLLKSKIAEYKPDIVHSHYGLSSLLSIFQRKVPVIMTLHGSDVNDKKVRPFSMIASKFAKKTIFVSQEMAELVGHKSALIIPCGVNLNIFYPIEKQDARKILGMDNNKKYILFSSSFENRVKNYPLAKQALNLLEERNIHLLELKGLSREKVALLLNAADLALMTSFSEGSPQFIKEAMACNCPVVSTDVGDVKWLFGNTPGCYIANSEPEDVAAEITLAIKFNKRTLGKQRMLKLGLDTETIANRIIDVYNNVLSK